MLSELQPGDTLLVTSLDRLARSTHDTLLVTSLDRLARSTHDLFIITRKIEAVDASFRVTTQVPQRQSTRIEHHNLT